MTVLTLYPFGRDLQGVPTPVGRIHQPSHLDAALSALKPHGMPRAKLCLCLFRLHRTGQQLSRRREDTADAADA